MTTKIENKESFAKKTLEILYPKFENFYKENPNIRPSVMLGIYIIELINFHHIYKKWNKKFKEERNYNPQKFSENPEYSFYIDTFEKGKNITKVIKLWEYFNHVIFVKDLAALDRVCANINTLMLNEVAKNKIFNVGFNVGIDWYGNICEYYSSNISNYNSNLSTCAIKFMLRRNAMLSSYDLCKFIKTMFYNKVKKLFHIIIQINNPENLCVITAKTSYGVITNKIIKTCSDIIDASDASIYNICSELIRVVIYNIQQVIQNIDDIEGSIKSKNIKINCQMVHLLCKRNIILMMIHSELNLFLIISLLRYKIDASDIKIKIYEEYSITLLDNLNTMINNIKTYYNGIDKKNYKAMDIIIHDKIIKLSDILTKNFNIPEPWALSGSIDLGCY